MIERICFYTINRKNMKNTINIKNAKEIGVFLIAAILVLISVFNIPLTFAQIPGRDVGLNGILSRTMESLQNYRIKNTSSVEGDRLVIFSQRPYTPEESYNFYTSDSNSGYLCQEDFWNLTDLINDLHWYGLSLIFDNGWTQGDPNGMQFEIIFYEDDGGYPGNIFTIISDLEPILKNTGLSYSSYTMYYWEIDLPEIVPLVNGWISIQSTYCPDGSWFLWSGSPEGNFNAIQSNYSIGDNLAFNITGGWFIPHPDIKIDSIIQPVSGQAGIIEPIINVTNVGNMDRIFPVNIQISSSTIEYNQTQNNIHLWPGDSQQIIFQNWTPEEWHNTIENKIIEYTIVATAIVDWDCNQSDNTLIQSFNLTYTNEVHRLFFFGFISNRTEDNSSISFYAKHLFCYDHNTSDYNRLYSDEKIIVSKKHRLGFVGKGFIIGKFNGVVFSSIWLNNIFFFVKYFSKNEYIKIS